MVHHVALYAQERRRRVAKAIVSGSALVLVRAEHALEALQVRAQRINRVTTRSYPDPGRRRGLFCRGNRGPEPFRPVLRDTILVVAPDDVNGRPCRPGSFETRAEVRRQLGV